ncbi:hypothetical protein [Azonexus sp.]|jgi:hypothetical protein|uniref:hypothetical protein n=1 Tax=Azonexus sp. TaxID=1872668 RepID=UPI00282D798C|nr:hypothetical protein [Azonexus sp.]MDR1996697.1 hypothetical protein [Azonexus sp.]
MYLNDRNFLMVDNMTEQNTNPDLKQDSANGKCHDRRRFLGAGAAATPFLLTLVSQPALGMGTACFTPSRSLSRNTSVSQQGKYGECQNAQSPGNYAVQQQVVSMGGIWPDVKPPTTSLDSVFILVPQFVKQVNEGGTLVSKSMTLGEALRVNGVDQVYLYLIAAYLNTMGGGGASIPETVLTDTAIQGIWREYTLRHYYEPMAGIQWSAGDIINYLQTNGIVG